jgi:hypothetical protein
MIGKSPFPHLGKGMPNMPLLPFRGLLKIRCHSLGATKQSATRQSRNQREEKSHAKTQSRKGKRETRNGREKAQKAQKGGLKILVNAPSLRRDRSIETFWVDVYRTTVVLRFSFFAPFCGYSGLRFSFAALRLCVRFLSELRFRSLIRDVHPRFRIRVSSRSAHRTSSCEARRR